MVDRLKAALPLLSDSEQELIQAIFFDGHENGVPRYAFLRGTLTNAEQSFRAEVAGSDKRYSFCLQPEG